MQTSKCIRMCKQYKDIQLRYTGSSEPKEYLLTVIKATGKFTKAVKCNDIIAALNELTAYAMEIFDSEILEVKAEEVRSIN